MRCLLIRFNMSMAQFAGFPTQMSHQKQAFLQVIEGYLDRYQFNDFEKDRRIRITILKQNEPIPGSTSLGFKPNLTPKQAKRQKKKKNIYTTRPTTYGSRPSCDLYNLLIHDDRKRIKEHLFVSRHHTIHIIILGIRFHPNHGKSCTSNGRWNHWARVAFCERQFCGVFGDHKINMKNTPLQFTNLRSRNDILSVRLSMSWGFDFFFPVDYDSNTRYQHHAPASPTHSSTCQFL